LPEPFPFSRNFFALEWPLLLDCCCALSTSTHPSIVFDASLNLDSLLALAQAHGVIAQLADYLNAGEPEGFSIDSRESLQHARRAQSVSTMALIAELFRVQEILSDAQVAAAVVKGPVLSVRAFGDSSARHYGDIDFLLRSRDIRHAAEAMAAAGYQPSIAAAAIRAQKTPGQYAFRRAASSPLVEFHTERTLRYFPRPLPIDDFFQRISAISIDGRSVPALALVDEFVLISVHGAKHFWERLMWIADVAAIVHRHPLLDWERVHSSARQTGAERMVRIALLLAERVLHVPVPSAMKSDVASDPACSRVVEKIHSWLPYAGYTPPALAQRALFRLRMRAHLLAGARYLTRLSLLPTEEDWSQQQTSHSAPSSISEALRRPFRLAKKYRRNPNS